MMRAARLLFVSFAMFSVAGKCMGIYLDGEYGISTVALKERPPAMLGTIKITPCDERQGYQLPTYWLCGKCDLRCETEIEMNEHALACEAPEPPHGFFSTEPPNISLPSLEEFYTKAANAGIFSRPFAGQEGGWDASVSDGSESECEQSGLMRSLMVDTLGIKEIKRKSRRRDTESWSGRQIGGGNGEREKKKDEWSLEQDSEEVRAGILRGVPLTTFQDTDIYANVRIQELKEYESSEEEKVEDEDVHAGEDAGGAKDRRNGGVDDRGMKQRGPRGWGGEYGQRNELANGLSVSAQSSESWHSDTD